MALLYIDSFDHYATADLNEKWSTTFDNPLIISGGRNGTNCAEMDGNDWIQRSFTASATWIVGAAVRTSGLGGNNDIFMFLDTGTNQFEVRITAGGNMQIVRGGTTTLATGTIFLSANTWYFIEVKLVIDNAGSCVVRVNGIQDINFSGDTQQTANASANALRLESATDTILFDDLYVADTSGGAPTNDFLGDVRVEAIYPNGNGNSSQFDGSDGNSTDNYLLVDETAPDADTTYVQSPDVGDKDTYAFGNMVTTSGTVYGVQPVPYARKTDAGLRSICSVARLSATETDSADKTLSTDYLYLPDIREAKPGGGVWTISDVNSAEFGQKVTV